MAAYRQVYDSRHLQADYQEPGSAPEPYVRQSSIGYLYFFYFWVFTLSQKKTICNPLAHPTWKYTTLTCEVPNFFYLTEGLHCTCIFRRAYLRFSYMRFPVLAFSAPPPPLTTVHTSIDHRCANTRRRMTELPHPSMRAPMLTDKDCGTVHCLVLLHHRHCCCCFSIKPVMSGGHFNACQPLAC